MSVATPSFTDRDAGERFLLKVIVFCFSMLMVGSFPARATPTAPPTPAASVPSAPYLRIEAGEHVAMINRVATNQDASLLLTVSDDKTGRLWNLPGGEAKGVLRVPIGDGTEGSIYAGALSPDGRTALLAGDITNQENHYSLYLYDTTTLRMKNRLSKLPAPILHLAYAPDGKQFVAAFSGGMGIIVWDATNGKRVGEDRDYGAACNMAVYAGDGRLATASDDGFIRLYDPQAKPIAKIKGQGGKQPYGLAFSPDGKLLAVGYKDKLAVDVIDTASGKVVKSPDVKGLAGENLSMVAWSGGELLAAGGAGKGDKRMIRRWLPGLGKSVDLPVAENTVTSLATLPDGRILFATAEPSWGIVTAEGAPLVRHDAPITDFRGIFRRHLALSANGLVVEWQRRPGSKERVRFDLARQELTLNPPQDMELFPPLFDDPGQLVSGWENAVSPLLKKKYPISLERNEVARSLAIAPDRGSYVLGTDYYLRWYNDLGEDLGKIDVPVSAYGVNFSRDGRYVVAALADGTLRWYRLNRGGQAVISEYAAIFPSIDGQRWIAWTKEGFFGHSMNGGKNLAGYHLNRGPTKTPEWIEFGQLYQSFYSPSLLARKLEGGHEAALSAQQTLAQEVIQRLFVAPAPEVELVEYCPTEVKTATRAFRRVQSVAAAPAAGAAATPTTPTEGCVAIGKSTTTRAFSRAPKSATAEVARQEEPVLQRDELAQGKKTVRLRFKIKERDGGLGEIHLMRNGVVVENADAKTRGFSRAAAKPPTAASAPVTDAAKVEDVILERDMELNTGVNRIQVRAYDGLNSAHAKSGLVELVVPEEVVAVAAEPQTRGGKPTLHILSVGVDKYRQPEFTLRYAVKDARDVAGLIEKNLAASFGKVELITRYDENATLEHVEKAFDELAAKVSNKDTVVIYLAGHGVNENNTYYFITQNATTEDFEKTSLSQGLLAQHLAKVSEKAENILVFLDSCHSGAFDVKGQAGTDIDRETESISKVRDRVGDVLMIAAAGPGQEAADGYVMDNGKHSGNGLFGYTVLSGLKGGAASVEEKEITASQIAGYVTRKINRIRIAQPKYTQKPVAIPTAGDLSRLEFALVEKKEP